ncbi:restriction endonuclease subunit S [Rhizobium sp. NLR9a]|uniref:restriction endonuclease subunit S n=1 Tax=unclassified Rhizobium TaxID=2613769 RepID=UPI001C8396CF|nr:MULTISPECIES: restriction endonuclease subunit S [unclassified Rhizobium]MBX5216487.1 restriction endonuclease subunit S [Rhizobium sp. NLR9a]MBX5277831.1 restriction endonuclease subunit S [Rhizobium sp. NLR13a]
MRDGWCTGSLGSLVRVASGQVDPKIDGIGDLPSVGPENLFSGGGLDLASIKSAREQGHISGKYAFDNQAILYSKIRPNLNKVALPDFAGICSADMYPLWVSDETQADRQFLFYALTSDNFVAEASARSFRTGLPKINRPDLESIEILVPPIEEQRKIGAILQTWDEAIEKLKVVRKAKERRHIALTHSLVFGARQLARFHATDEVTAHRWFTLPASWRCKPIGKLASEISERNADAMQHEVLSCSKHDGFVRSLEYFKKQVFSTDLSGYKKIWRGDFGFPSNHVEEGSIGLQNLTDLGVVSPIYTVFRFASDKVDADYAFAVLKTGLYRHIFEVSTSSSVDRRGSLRWSEFSRLPFPVPSLAEQKAIAEVLRTARTELKALTTEIDLLVRQKRGLMQRLLTGEWRVKLEE